VNKVAIKGLYRAVLEKKASQNSLCHAEKNIVEGWGRMEG
jgi:hypothetical protein